MKRIQVGDKVYTNEMVADGMFDSLKSLKSPDMNEYKNLPSYSEAVSAYNHIIKIASSGARLPTITFFSSFFLEITNSPIIVRAYRLTAPLSTKHTNRIKQRLQDTNLLERNINIITNLTHNKKSSVGTSRNH